MKFNLCYYPLMQLNKIGLLTSQFNKKLKFLLYLVYVIMIPFLQIMLALQLRYSKNVYDFVSNLEAVTGLLNIAGKILLVIHNKQNFITLLRFSKKLIWNSSGLLTQYHLQLKNTFLRVVLLFQKFYMIFMFISHTGTLMNLVLFNILPLGSWTVQEYPEILHKLVASFEIFCMPIMGTFVGAFDCLFVGFSFNLIIQYKLFCHCLNNFSVENIRSQLMLLERQNELIRMIKHHEFLLSYMKLLQETYSLPLFVQIFSIAPVLCADFYGILEGDDFALIARYTTAWICAFLQTALYCFTIDILQHESSKMSYAIYSCNWYSNYHPDINKAIILMLQKSQQNKDFMAGGLIVIDCRVLLTILKTSWSAYAVIKVLK